MGGLNRIGNDRPRHLMILVRETGAPKILGIVGFGELSKLPEDK